MLVFAAPYPASAVAVSDPYFDNVLLLVGADGTNGSTSFTDESPYARTLTAGGTAQISTAQFEYGTGSAAFDGSGTCQVSAPSSADWAFAGDFTMECWIRLSALAGSTVDIIGQDGTTSANSGAYLYVGVSTATLDVALFGPTLSGTGVSGRVLGSGTIGWTLGQWYHVVAERSGSTLRLYRDGTMVAKCTVTGSVQNAGAPFVLGNGFAGALNGWLDEVRLTGGVARYASDAGYAVPAAKFPRVGPSPSFSVNPVITSPTGFYGVGDVLTATPGTYSAGTTGTAPTYQGLANGVPISGATGTTFTVTSTQLGAMITVQETVTNAYGSASATSSGVGPIVTPTFTTDTRVPAGDMQSGSDGRLTAGDMQSGTDLRITTTRTA